MRQLYQVEPAKKAGGEPALLRQRGGSHVHDAQADHAARQLAAVRVPHAHAATSSNAKSFSPVLQRQCACGSSTCPGCLDEGRRPGATATRSTTISRDGDVETRTQLVGGPAGPTPLPAPNHCALTSATFTSIPSGTLAATLSGGRLQAPFIMRATFANPVPCSCANGEYRQFVRGSFTAGGSAVTHTLGPGRTLSPTAFQEDGDLALGTAYGYRSSPGTGSRFRPSQADGCQFEGEDAPGIQSSPGTVVSMNLDFIGSLIDTSQGNRIVTSAQWSVSGTATMP